MNSLELKSIIEQYYQREVKAALQAISKPTFNKKEVINNTLQRCLGIAFFAQELPSAISYETIEELYTNVREELKQL